MNDKENDVDNLSYQWPANVLEYEARFWGGFTLTNMLAAAGPFMAGIMIGQNSGSPILGLVLGAIGGVLGLLITRPFAALTGLSLPVYLYRRSLARWRQPVIEMPLIMPGGDQQLAFEDWDGAGLIKIEND